MRKILKLNLIFILFLSLFFLGGCKKKENDDNKTNQQEEYAEVKGIIYYSKTNQPAIPDKGAKVFLLKKIDKDLSNDDAKFVAEVIKYPLSSYVGDKIKKYNDLGIYATTVASDGSYSFSKVKNGEYSLVFYSLNAKGTYNKSTFYKYYHNSSDYGTLDYNIPLSENQAMHYGFRNYGDKIWSNWVEPFTKYGWKSVTIEGNYEFDVINFGKSDY
ncbi:MAG: hypothetical protein MR485_01520 [Mollicutes bacterium]|nr:hypothetical protein [Mollicutes bacterium]